MASNISLLGLANQIATLNISASSANTLTFTTGGIFGTSNQPVDGGNLTLNTATMSSVVIELGSNAPANALNLNLLPMTSFDIVGKQGKIVIVERSLTGRMITFDARFNFPFGTTITNTSTSPISSGYAIDTIDYYIPRPDVVLAQYTRMSKYIPASTVMQWVNRLGSSGGSEYTTHVSAALDDGGFFVVGYYNNNTSTTSAFKLYSINNSEFATSLSIPSASYSRGFVARYNKFGTPLWLAGMDGDNHDVLAMSCATASDGGVFVCGSFRSTNMQVRSYGGAAFTTQATRIGNATYHRGWLAKYSSAGAVQWLVYTTSTTTQHDYCSDVAATLDGGCSLAVSYNSASIEFIDVTGNGTTITNSNGNGLTATALVKITSTGNLISNGWVCRVVPGPSGNAQSRSTCVIQDGGVILAGFYGTSTSFLNKANASTGTTLPNAGSNDVFVVKFDGSGNSALWTTRISGTGGDDVQGVVDTSDGGFVVCGYFNSTTLTSYHANSNPFTPTLTVDGMPSAYIVKYSSDGFVQWNAKISGASTTTASSVTRTADGNIVVSGYFNSTTLTAYNSTGGTFATTLSTNGQYDNFLVKYNTTTGLVIWVAKIASAGNENNSVSLAATADNAIVVTSAFTPASSYASTSSLVVYDKNGQAYATPIQAFGNLYSFSTANFVTGYSSSVTSNTGSSLSTFQSTYAGMGYTWASQLSFFNVTTPGIQTWTVPISGIYQLDMAGAKGGSVSTSGLNAGYGATFRVSNLAFKGGDTVTIIVGQGGGSFGTGGVPGAGGGGFSAVWINGTIAFVAGGGGGSTESGPLPANAPQTNSFGSTATPGTGGMAGAAGSSNGQSGGLGFGGTGGSASSGSYAGGGGGGGCPSTTTASHVGGSAASGTQSNGCVGGFGCGGGGGASTANATWNGLGGGGGGGGWIAGNGGNGSNSTSAAGGPGTSYINTTLGTLAWQSNNTATHGYVSFTLISVMTDSFIVKIDSNGMMT